jgi:molybdopterin converting factor small subunit
MKVTVKFLAHFKNLAGTDTLGVTLPEGANIAALVATLAEQLNQPALRNERALFIVNQTNSTPETVLQDGDEVLMLHLIGGGT